MKTIFLELPFWLCGIGSVFLCVQLLISDSRRSRVIVDFMPRQLLLCPHADSDTPYIAGCEPEGLTDKQKTAVFYNLGHDATKEQIDMFLRLGLGHN